MNQETPIPWEKLSEVQAQSARLPLGRVFAALVLFALCIANCALAAAILLDTHEMVEPSRGPIAFLAILALLSACGGGTLLRSTCRPDR